MLAVTGANGHLGSRLLRQCGDAPVRALVRSETAARRLQVVGLGASAEPRIVDYLDAAALGNCLDGCRSVVHLVGIIKESRANRYRQAHEGTCAALARAAADAGVQRIVYLSILGASAASDNACLESRGAAERILLASPVPVTIIRVPMVLGEADFAARALAARARRSWNLVLRGESLEQPIYAGDVISAILTAIAPREGDLTYELAGPESLPRAALIQRAAAVLGRRTRVVSLPLGAGLLLAGLLEKLQAEPPVTRAMLGVLDHDDRIDPRPAAGALGVSLTPLDEALKRCLQQEAAS